VWVESTPGLVSLFLRFFKENVLAQRRVKLIEFNFALHAPLILTGPDNVAGLRGLEPNESVL